MRATMWRLWADDRGAIISVEWLMFTVFFIIGLLPALVMLRQGIALALANAVNYAIASAGAWSITVNTQNGPVEVVGPTVQPNNNFPPNNYVSQGSFTFQGTQAFSSNITNVGGNAANVPDPTP